jgi:hypothetical protein
MIKSGQARALRMMMMKYLREQLLESSEIGPRADNIAMAIDLMTSVANAEDSLVYAAICSSAYSLCKLFANYTV